MEFPPVIEKAPQLRQICYYRLHICLKHESSHLGQGGFKRDPVDLPDRYQNPR